MMWDATEYNEIRGHLTLDMIENFKTVISTARMIKVRLEIRGIDLAPSTREILNRSHLATIDTIFRL